MSIENPRDVPEQWRPYFDKRGIEFTFNALARKAEGISLGTVIRVLTGEGNPTNRVAGTIGDVLGISVEKVRELRGEPPLEPFVLPTRARLLTNSEREVVRSVVNAILDARHNPSAKSDAQEEIPQDQKTRKSARSNNPQGGRATGPLLSPAAAERARKRRPQ